MVDAARLNRTDGAMVRVITPIRGEGQDGVAAAEQLAISFTRQLMPALEGFLPE
jgi:hypothetical protein